MASRKSTGNKTRASRANAVPPKASAARPVAGGATTLVPKPPFPGGAQAKAAPPEHFKNTALGFEKKKDKPTKPAVSNRGSSTEVMDGGDPLKKQELIAQVVERSDIAKKYAKPVIEAMLSVLGDALAEGREVNLQPMGKIKPKRIKDGSKVRVIIANIRQPKSAGTAGATAAPLAGSTPAAGSTNLTGTLRGGKPGPGGPASPSAPPARHPLKEAVAEGDD
ncbi:MAG: HU family DNA-binding protein [Roseovarius sp.]